MMVNISVVKKEFTTRFPDHKLTSFLKNTPDELEPAELFMLCQIWIKILNEK
jgi:hypothetical protein